MNGLGRPAEAVEAFSEALALVPDRAPIYLYRGEALLALGERAMAEQDSDQADRLANGDPRVAVAVRLQQERLRRR